MIQIRHALDSDAEGIRRVARRAWHDAYDALDPDVIDATIEEWYAGPVGSALHGWAEDIPVSDLDVEATMLVARDDEQVVGFAQGVAYGPVGTVLRLYVDPTRHRKRVGTRLYERLREIFAEQGVERVRALDLADNDASREFFRKLGFEQTATRTVTIGGDPYDEAVYTRELDETAE
ncbi:GNAT family N-acetyltransferase [Halomicroarcula sp. F13]|uniref:GNAT family N-acetyltransferase n=1 Tax=Haloarcula rubra TaxID=2487747 RepID=A0AAW4PN62_9EURY|nr:GNAT family N-acetyltransferase [Halomicroarcula rubra]MBX0322035.1 GNAT family N-acetyltransferase [Halomicroarcula rubra]